MYRGVTVVVSLLIGIGLFVAGVTYAYYLRTNSLPQFADGSSSDSINTLLDDEFPTPGSSRESFPETDMKKPRVSIVIDDLGWVREPTEIYDRINNPLTMAVMPGRPHSKWFYNRWKDKFEFIIHMPMEPLGYPEDDPGKFALMTDMGKSKIENRLQHIFEKYPVAVGMNNHMGSAFTQDRPAMGTLMEFLAERGYFYMDSKTTSASVAREVARKWDVPVVSNQVFLDRERNYKSIKSKLDELVRIAKENGSAIGIGHMQSMDTARVLEDHLPKYASSGINFVPLSRIINPSPKRTRF